MFLVRVVWYIYNDDADLTTVVKHVAYSPIVTRQATEQWV